MRTSNVVHSLKGGSDKMDRSRVQWQKLIYVTLNIWNYEDWFLLSLHKRNKITYEQ